MIMEIEKNIRKRTLGYSKFQNADAINKIWYFITEHPSTSRRLPITRLEKLQAGSF